MKDAVGNDLKIGDLVAVNLDRPMIFGRVIEVKDGGLIVGMKGGKPEVHMGRVMITSNHTIEVDPRTTPLIGSVLGLREDNRIPEVQELDKKPVEAEKPN